MSTEITPLGDFPIDLPAMVDPVSMVDPVPMGGPMASAPQHRSLPPIAAHVTTSAQSLTRAQKAAIIVRLLLADGADLPLSEFPEELQHSLTRSMGSMKSITRETMDEVVQEFLSEIDSVGMFFPGGLDGALKVLEGALSPTMVTRLRREAGGVFYGDPWEKVVNLPLDVLLVAMESEAIEVCAVMLSKLAVPHAAELLGMIDGERARRIAFAISQTKSVTPEAVRRIGISLATQLNNRPPVAFDDDPVDRVGAILNFAAASRRDEVLDGLDAENKEFGALVRRAIFTFSNIPQRIHKRDLAKIIRIADQADLVTSLAYAQQSSDQQAVDFILENMSNRLANSITDEIKDAGSIKVSDGEGAQSRIVNVVRRLEETGDLSLKMGDDPP